MTPNREGSDSIGMDPGPITLVGVWAHPDDETYLSATLMHRVISAGGRVVVITATAGEQGLPSTADDPVSTRETELRNALAAVGVHEVVLLGIPDGGCSEQDPEAQSARIATVLDGISPDAVVTFGPDGITGHPDHIAVSAWTLTACESRSCEVYLAAMTTSFAQTHRALHERIGLSMSDRPLPSVPEAEVVGRISPTQTELAVKLAAFDAHGSQTVPLRAMIGDDAFESWWIDETFRLPTDADFDWARSFRPRQVTA